MTGYASAQQGNAREAVGSPAAAAISAPNSAATAAPSVGGLGVEIRSVNNRFLELTLRLPDEFRQHEPALRELIAQHIRRGKVEVRIWLEQTESQSLPQPSAGLLQRLNGLQDSIQVWLPGAASLSVADVIRLCGSGQTPAKSHSAASLLALVQHGAVQLVAARAREGERLALMLLDRLAQLRCLAGLAQPLIPLLVAQQKKRFLERWQEALELGKPNTKLEISDDATATPLPDAVHERALSEATAFAIRIDVAEELTRLDSHLDEIERLLKQGGELGKRLDFLIQELQREANTLGSKSSTLELSRIAMDMKVLIEQMREQVQNIE